MGTATTTAPDLSPERITATATQPPLQNEADSYACIKFIIIHLYFQNNGVILCRGQKQGLPR